jgi:hypothetical protein
MNVQHTRPNQATTPTREFTTQQTEFVHLLRERFFLIPRDYTKSIIGGALAFLILAGVISLRAAKGALETAVAKKTADDIVALHATAKTHVDSLGADSYVRYDTKLTLECKRHSGLHLHAGSDKAVTVEGNALNSPFVRWTIQRVPDK